MVSNMGTSTRCPRPVRTRAKSAAKMPFTAAVPTTRSAKALGTYRGVPSLAWAMSEAKPEPPCIKSS